MHARSRACTHTHTHTASICPHLQDNVTSMIAWYNDTSVFGDATIVSGLDTLSENDGSNLADILQFLGCSRESECSPSAIEMCYRDPRFGWLIA